MSQIRTRVFRSMNGSTQYLDGSGIINMSLSLIAAQPRKLLASKPSPFSNTSSVSSSMGKVRWCQAPIRSVNLRSKNSTFSSAANFRTFLGFMFSSGRVFIVSLSTQLIQSVSSPPRLALRAFTHSLGPNPRDNLRTSLELELSAPEHAQACTERDPGRTARGIDSGLIDWQSWSPPTLPPLRQLRFQNAARP